MTGNYSCRLCARFIQKSPHAPRLRRHTSIKSHTSQKTPTQGRPTEDVLALDKRRRSGANPHVPNISTLFATRLYRAALSEFRPAVDLSELEATCLSVAGDDDAGHDWCEANQYPGYTSYASLTDLPWRFPVFKRLVKALDRHVSSFGRDLEFDLGGKALKLEDIWVNILPEGGTHSGHIHPHSAISGTVYVSMPAGTSAIRFEDPRLPMMMASPPRQKSARAKMRTFAYVEPVGGDVLLWESWLRHEVPMNNSRENRMSISFNYGWG